MKNATPRLLAATAGLFAIGLAAAQAAPAVSNRPDDGRFTLAQATPGGQSRNGGQENPVGVEGQRQGLGSTTGSVPRSGDQVGRSSRTGGQESTAASPNRREGTTTATRGRARSGDQVGRSARTGGQENPARSPVN